MIYERNLQPMKLAILKGTRQDQAVLALAARLGISRQRLRKILISRCDMMTLENLGPRLEAADEAAAGDPIADALSLPHLTAATGILPQKTGNRHPSPKNRRRVPPPCRNRHPRRRTPRRNP